MAQRVKLLLVGILSMFSFAAPIAVPIASAQNVEQEVCDGIELGGGGDCTNTAEGEDRIIGIIETVINVLSLLVGAICVIMIIIGGFRYLTSAGESSGVTGAKNTILYAIVGLVIVLLAQVIVRFVFARTTTGPA